MLRTLYFNQVVYGLWMLWSSHLLQVPPAHLAFFFVILYILGVMFQYVLSADPLFVISYSYTKHSCRTKVDNNKLIDSFLKRLNLALQDSAGNPKFGVFEFGPHEHPLPPCQASVIITTFRKPLAWRRFRLLISTSVAGRVAKTPEINNMTTSEKAEIADLLEGNNNVALRRGDLKRGQNSTSSTRRRSVAYGRSTTGRRVLVWFVLTCTTSARATAAKRASAWSLYSLPCERSPFLKNCTTQCSIVAALESHSQRCAKTSRSLVCACARDFSSLSLRNPLLCFPPLTEPPVPICQYHSYCMLPIFQIPAILPIRLVLVKYDAYTAHQNIHYKL